MTGKYITFSIILLAALCIGVASYNYIPSLVNSAQAETEEASGMMAEASDPDEEHDFEPRILGNPDAPIKISEHSSLTCGHCGAFHKETFDQLKAEYIDTGKAYLVFNDFPLNLPALHGSMIARCLPKAQFFDFIDFLFKTQNDWAYNQDYLTYLKQNAQLMGLPEAEVVACINNQDLQKKIIDAVSLSKETHNIASTPSFVINDSVVISGNKSMAEFRQVLDNLE